MSANAKIVFILGSGPSISRMSEKDLDLVRAHPNTFALNRFYMFHEAVGIVPKMNFLLDRGWPAAYVLVKTLERAEREGHALTYFLHRGYEPLLANHHRAVAQLRQQAEVSGWEPPERVRCPANVKIRYFDNITESRIPFYWATSMEENLYFYRGSLTTALNLVNVTFPDHHICLLGVDLNTPDRFFSSLEDQDRVLNGQMSATYEERRISARMAGLHGTSIPYKGTRGIQSVIPRIRDRLAENGVNLFLGTEDSLLEADGVLSYVPVHEALDGAPIGKPAPPRAVLERTFEPVHAISDAPLIAPDRVASPRRVAIVTRGQVGHNGAWRSGKDVCDAVERMPDVATSIFVFGVEGVWKKIKRRAKRPRPWKVPKYAYKKIRRAIRQLPTRLSIARQMQNAEFDCAIYNSIGALEYKAGHKLRRKQSVLIVRESPRHFIDNTMFSLEFAIEGMKSADWIIFCSNQVREEWHRIAELPPSIYIPNAPPEAEAAEVRKLDREVLRTSWGIAKDEFAVGCVASWQPRKGIDVLLDQFETVLAAVPNARCHFIGNPRRAYGKRLSTWIERSRIRDAVVVHGSSSQALEFIRACDVLAVPSRAEAFPRVCLEAMTLGTPIVASNVDGIPEMVEHRKTGMLFDLDAPEGLSEAIIELSREPALGSHIAREASHRVERHFRLEQLYARYAGAIRHIMSSASSDANESSRES